MKKWNRLLSLCIGFCIAVSTPAYATTIIVPPAPIGNENSAGTGTAPENNQNSGPGTEETPTQNNQTATTVTNAAAPEIQAQGAVLMDAATGRVLYEKNGNTQYFPASITKLMTALLVAERCNLDDVVTFSKTATTNLEAGSVTLNLTEGDKLTVRQSLYALMLKSANEVANGLAEHVGGSIAGFADMMNAKAAALGCTNTHFANPNGLNNSGHYTTPRDMALIARAAFSNETVCKVSSTLSYEIPATQKAGARKVTMGHKMLYPNNTLYYSGIIGGKTGYTSLAGNTLVTGVERDGVRLIAVIMKSKSTQYADTKALLDYGYGNLQTLGLKEGTPASTAKWVQDNSKWYFLKQDGTKAVNEWMKVDDVDYWFDSDSYMATGWRQFSNGAWYYFKSSGAMAKSRWEKSGDNWCYVGADGVMLANATTPDGYQVDGNGIWVTN